MSWYKHAPVKVVFIRQVAGLPAGTIATATECHPKTKSCFARLDNNDIIRLSTKEIMPILIPKSKGIVAITGSNFALGHENFFYMVYRPKHIPNNMDGTKAHWPPSCPLLKYWVLKPFCLWNNNLSLASCQSKKVSRTHRWLQKWLRSKA